MLLVNVGAVVKKVFGVLPMAPRLLLFPLKRRVAVPVRVNEAMVRTDEFTFVPPFALLM